MSRPMSRIYDALKPVYEQSPWEFYPNIGKLAGALRCDNIKLAEGAAHIANSMIKKAASGVSLGDLRAGINKFLERELYRNKILCQRGYGDAAVISTKDRGRAEGLFEPCREHLRFFTEHAIKHAVGWPDLTLIHQGELVLREVKAGGDRLRKEQRAFFENRPPSLDAQVIYVNPPTRRDVAAP